jgi:release factor glutamine methyltransferase
MVHKPIQYVTGTVYFFGLRLKVDPSVLIPRPETEELVKWAADEMKGKSGLRILDIGTGSGCIILVLGSLLPGSDLTATDISQSALGVASQNASLCGTRVEFRISDILDETAWESHEEYDLIISNPPYVRSSEKGGMRANVLDFEPPAALFVPDDDPLVFYRAIAGFSQRKLAPGGKLFLEINENLGEETVSLIRQFGFTDMVMKKDMQGKDRFIRCCKPKLIGPRTDV